MKLHLPDKNKDEKSAECLITREVHLIDHLKAKMLIRVNIIEPEGINISVFKKTAYIDSCRVEVSITAQPHMMKPVYCVIHVKKFMIILLFSTTTIEIHHLSLSMSRDFLFEPSELVTLPLYSHMIDY